MATSRSLLFLSWSILSLKIIKAVIAQMVYRCLPLTQACEFWNQNDSWGRISHNIPTGFQELRYSYQKVDTTGAIRTTTDRLRLPPQIPVICFNCHDTATAQHIARLYNC